MALVMCARARLCSPSSPNKFFGEPNNGMRKPLAPSSSAFESLSLTASISCSSKAAFRDARSRHENSWRRSDPASVSDKFFGEPQSSPDVTMSVKARAVRSLCDSRGKIFLRCQYERSFARTMLCRTGTPRRPTLPRCMAASPELRSRHTAPRRLQRGHPG